jgi:hypothetical protein
MCISHRTLSGLRNLVLAQEILGQEQLRSHVCWAAGLAAHAYMQCSPTLELEAGDGIIMHHAMMCATVG